MNAPISSWRAPLNSRRLEHFLAVYEHRSFGRAASVVHVSQPALSKSIQLLEEELGVQLFERATSGVLPTIYGEALAGHAKVIQAEMQNAAREIATLSGANSGEVLIGATPSVAADLLPRVFEALQKSRPGIRLRVIEGLMEDHIPALRRGELDVFVGGWASDAHPDLSTKLIMRDQIRIFAAADHPLAGKSAVALPDLLTHPWILPPPTQFWVDQVMQIFVSSGLTPPVPHAVANSAGFIKAVLLQQDFLSALPARLLCAEVAGDSVVAIDVKELSVSVNITATYRRQAIRLSAFEVFMKVLTDVGQKLTAAART